MIWNVAKELLPATPELFKEKRYLCWIEVDDDLYEEGFAEVMIFNHQGKFESLGTPTDHEEVMYWAPIEHPVESVNVYKHYLIKENKV